MPNNELISITHAKDVNPAWVLKQMDLQGISVGKIVADTGVNQSNVSCWIHNRRPMSAPVKALFFNYFHYNNALKVMGLISTPNAI